MKELYKTLEMLLQNTSDEKAKNDLSQIFGEYYQQFPEKYSQKLGLTPNLDSSNNDIKYKRNFIRTKILPLLKEYWNQGIGTRLFQELIRIAEANPNLIQIELEFVEGNSRARALYEKMGFRITGVKPNAIRLKDGTLLNEYSMIREIKR